MDLFTQKNNKQFISIIIALLTCNCFSMEHHLSVRPDQEGLELLTYIKEHRFFGTFTMQTYHKLLHSGMNLNIQDKDGDTILHWLSQIYSDGFARATEEKKCTLDFIKYLINIGANPNIKNNVGLSPINIALMRGNSELAQSLIKCGAKLTMPGHDRSPNLEWIAKHYPSNATSFFIKNITPASIDINTQDRDGHTMLHFAILYGNSQLAHALLDREANPTILDLNGKSAIDYSLSINNAQCQLILPRLKAQQYTIIKRHVKAFILPTLTLAQHPRLGAHSPVGMLSQYTLQYLVPFIITVLTERGSAIIKEQHKSSSTSSCCIQ